MQTQSFLPINIYSDSFFLKKIEFNFGSNFESNFGSSSWVQSMFCTMPKIYTEVNSIYEKHYTVITLLDIKLFHCFANNARN